MKKFRLVFAGLLAIAFVGALFAFTSNVESSTAKRFTTVTYNWSGLNHSPAEQFPIGGSVSSSELSDIDNWGTSNPSCSGSVNVCKAIVTYTLTAGQTAPTQQQVITAIKDYYDINGTFPNGSTFNVTIFTNANISVDIQIVRKA